MPPSNAEQDSDSLDRYETVLDVDETIPTYKTQDSETFQPTDSEDMEDEKLQSLSSEDLVDKFEVFRERLNRINGQIQERKKLTQNFFHQTQKELDSFQFQLEEHRNTWKQLGINPSADRRRSFLEEKVEELVKRLYQINLDHFQNNKELEREKFDLLLDYLQLKRVAESLD